MKPAERLYDRIWSDQSSEDYRGGNLRVDLCAAVVGRGNRLLDLGCGDGTLGRLLLGRFAEVHGVDISTVAVEAAARKGLVSVRVNVDEDPLPYADAFFDAVTCLDLIEHVFEPASLTTEIARVLKPGGSLYIAFPNMRYLLRIKELLAGRFPKTSGDVEYAYDGGHLHYYTPADVRRLLGKCGLAVETEWGIVSPGVRGLWKYRLLNAILPERAAREFLSIEVLQRAIRS